MKISLIAAHDSNLVIGKNGTLPWHIPEDLAHFKKKTMGKPVIMGRKVFEDLSEKPLKGRRNIVLSRKANYNNIEVCRSRDEVFELLRDEEQISIIGGEQIYRLFWDDADQLDITLIHRSYNGDTYFPEYRNGIGKIWKEISREEHSQLAFFSYKRIQD